MDNKHYNKVGAVARAEPVNTMEVLFPNGFDRNLNTHDRPLVTVCDTANDDSEFSDYDDSKFESHSPSNNVTVTIKFSESLDGVVTETAKSPISYDRELFDTASKSGHRKTDKGNYKELKRSRSTKCPIVDSHCDKDIQKEVRPAAYITNTNSQIDSPSTHVRDSKQTTSSLNSDKEEPTVQNSLYDEYERFVEPSEVTTETVVRPKILKTRHVYEPTNEEDNSNPSVPPTVRDNPSHTKRNSLVSPICRTPIIVHSSNEDMDEGEDFMEYLKQLRGEPNKEISDEAEEIHDYIVEEPTEETRYYDSINPDEATIQESQNIVSTDELVPIFEVSATIFSDPESETDESESQQQPLETKQYDKNDDKSLLEFNFSSLAKPNAYTSVVSSELKPKRHQLRPKSECCDDTDGPRNHNKKHRKKTKMKKKIELRIVESSDESENSDDDKDDDDDDDTSSGDRKNYDGDDDYGSGASGNHGNRTADDSDTTSSGDQFYDANESNEGIGSSRHPGNGGQNYQNSHTSNLHDAKTICDQIGTDYKNGSKLFAITEPIDNKTNDKTARRNDSNLDDAHTIESNCFTESAVIGDSHVSILQPNDVINIQRMDACYVQNSDSEIESYVDKSDTGVSEQPINETLISETMSTASTESYTTEDNEVFKILDYSVITSGLDCTFQTIDNADFSELSEGSMTDHILSTPEKANVEEMDSNGVDTDVHDVNACKIVDGAVSDYVLPVSKTIMTDVLHDQTRDYENEDTNELIFVIPDGPADFVHDAGIIKAEIEHHDEYNELDDVMSNNELSLSDSEVCYVGEVIHEHNWRVRCNNVQDIDDLNDTDNSNEIQINSDDNMCEVETECASVNQRQCSNGSDRLSHTESPDFSVTVLHDSDESVSVTSEDETGNTHNLLYNREQKRNSDTVDNNLRKLDEHIDDQHEKCKTSIVDIGSVAGKVNISEEPCDTPNSSNQITGVKTIISICNEPNSDLQDQLDNCEIAVKELYMAIENDGNCINEDLNTCSSSLVIGDNKEPPRASPSTFSSRNSCSDNKIKLEENRVDDKIELGESKHDDKITLGETKLPITRLNEMFPVRTIYYMAPYIIESPSVKLTSSKLNVFKRLCGLRKLQLRKFNLVDDDANLAYKYIDDEKETESTKEAFVDDNLVMQGVDYQFDKPVKTIGRPGEIIKLGAGYYIFGTGEKLDLPIGPKLQKKLNILSDHDVKRRSMYFRGVPGIINNVYKMSNFSFPKKSITNDTSSRRILHACNRLATQLSPISPRQEFKHVTMNMAVDEKDDSTSDSCSSLTEMLVEARDFLNSARFDEAEASLLKLYKEIQEKPEDSGRLLVETLTGLADICIRRSRMCRSNPLEWQWLCMHAIALLQYTVEFCDSELESQLDNEASDWYQEQRQASELKCRPLEDAFTRALYNCLKHDANFFDPFQSFSLPNTPTQQRKQNLFPLSSQMPQYLLVPGMSYRVTDQGLRKQSSDDTDVAVDWLAKFQFYCKDRLQTKDSKGVTEKVLKSTKSTDNDETDSILSAGSHDSLDWDHTDLHGIEEITTDETTDVVETESPISDYSLEFELASSDNEGWDFFIHERRNCDFQSVVQVVSNKEKTDDSDADSSELEKETTDIYQQEKSEKTRRKHHEPREIVSPLHAHSISLTLARSFCRLADKLVQEEEYKKAEIVYEKILDIIDAIQDGTAGMLRFSARIMKNLGTVKSKQGKSSSGLVLLNKALNTYRDLQEEEANFEIAVALIELGNGYIVGKNHEDSVFDDVIIAICDFFEKDASDSHSTSTSSSVQSHISQMTSSLSSNNEDRNVEEAVTCYSEAITLLDCYEADEKQIDMFAKAVMRLGDCHFMQKDYDKALECYEKALGMFRTYNVFGKDSLMENAHVLCMLGVSSFMLHVYPRAASVFETALHMVRCAYGFKRTFLNGMLQSLCGITYYKMKNYHKCVSMCYQGYETYCDLFSESMPRLDKQKFWLVCQTLYVMGNSYNVLNLQHKAMKYLSIARSLMKSSKSRERRQFMRVLQILGDCYFAQYDYKAALQFYNEALEYGECESSISFDEVFDPNCASDEMTIHNHLVSKSAEAHLSMQQYQNAVHYLEQAHDMQEVMGEDIKGDLIHTLYQLGHMHSSAGDVDKAIESYKECLEVFREIHQGELGPEMCTTLGNLAAISYVKACLTDSVADEAELNNTSDEYFQEALKLENNVEVSIKYGNFLYSHCQFETAIVHLWNALTNDNINSHIVYRGLEKVTLPELLQDEVDTQEEICLPASCLARYLLILCHKAMHEMDEAEINLTCLMEDVLDYDIPLMHSLLGYAMMELWLFEEAAECFLAAVEGEEDYQLACENYCICLLILLQKALIRGVENILAYVRKTTPSYCIDYESFS